MADVYRVSKNVLACYTHGVCYTGFENGSETCIEKIPVTLYGNTLTPGEKITGLISGKDRTSFELDYGYMTYMGIFNNELLFEICDPKENVRQLSLFSTPPKWMLSFSLIGTNAGLLMFSQPGACYDIHPFKITRY
jgi:hypothetical protein